MDKWIFLIVYSECDKNDTLHKPWASYQIRKIAGCGCTGNAGKISPPRRISDPGMNHGTCVTHVPWCMPGSLTSGFLWSRWREKRSRHPWRMRNPPFYVSRKRPMGLVVGRKNPVAEVQGIFAPFMDWVMYSLGKTAAQVLYLKTATLQKIAVHSCSCIV